MKNLKSFLVSHFLIAIAAAPALIGQSTPPPEANFFPRPPTKVGILLKDDSGARIRTFSILPGQALKVYNPYYDFIKIESNFPVAVHMGKCESESTTEFECREAPADSYVIVYDSRVGISPDFSPLNPIKFTAVHHTPSN
jgi:hypothetical protein